MHHTLEVLIARIALSMYVSGRKVERVPRVTEFHPCPAAEIAAPANVSLSWYALAAQTNAHEGI